MKLVQVIAIIACIAIIASLVAMIFKLINPLTFYLIGAVCAALAWWVLPRFRGKV